MKPPRTLAPDLTLVDEHIARNPLARAIARRRMEQAARDFAIRLHLMTDGEDAAGDAIAAARTIHLAHIVSINAGLGDTPDARVMAGALSAMAALARRGFAWRTADAVAIDGALQRAIATLQAASAQQTQAAWREMQRQDQAADARHAEGTAEAQA